MSGFTIGFAVLFLMAAGFVWGREGIRWSQTGIWRSYTVNDFFGLLFGRNMASGDGLLNNVFALFGGADLGFVFILIGLGIYWLGVRGTKS